MIYTISYPNASNHSIFIQLFVQNIDSDHIKLQLPSWRPGRYELANFAKNIQQFKIVDHQNQPVHFHKMTKDRWWVHTKNTKEVKVVYSYYAQQRDAGGSWLDETLVYINFINCALYVEGRLAEPCEIRLNIPEYYQLACGLKRVASRVLLADNYYQLVDSPLMASASMQHEIYQVGKHIFHLWLWGNCSPNWTNVKAHFQQYTAYQIKVMGDFPCEDYHFLLQFVPYQHYHGVEHQNSTVIVLGPDSEFEKLYPELLGICSHELFHTWNVIRIRPKELMPYDFTKENYFPTGFVAEGVTTYYGDLFLKQSGVISTEEYLQELATTLRRHFELNGRSNQSLIESSFDLWLDGYVAGVPNRKVSIYHKGAVAALILDLEIRQRTDHVRSLDDVMRFMWNYFGKSQMGYTLDDYRAAVEEVTGRSQQSYFDECITGNSPLEDRLNQALVFVGLEMLTDELGKVSLISKELITEAEKINLKKWLNE